MKNLDKILRRSVALDEGIISLLEPKTYRLFDSSKRASASFAACNLSLEYARGLRVLILEKFPASAIGLMRLQFEALTRSVWLLYAASDTDVERLQAPLDSRSEKTANRLPMLAGMMLAKLTGNADLEMRMGGIQPAFMDCLPELLPTAAN